MKEVYKRKFKETNFNQDVVLDIFEKYIPGYGGGGPHSEDQYFKVVTTLLKYISNDLNDVIEDDTDLFSSKSKEIAKKLLSLSVKKF